MVFKEEIPESEVAPTANRLARSHGGNLRFIYEYALKGFSVQLPEAAAIALSNNPQVKYVEENTQGSIVETEFNSPQGLDRIDQRNLPLDNAYTYGATGAGVNVYIIDTGIRASHVDFGGRASVGMDFLGERNCNGYNNDCNGHGTHVAGTVGGSTYGVAKSVTLRSVKVCDTNGSCDGAVTMNGIEFVTRQKRDNPGTPMVANMSLEFAPNSSIDDAVRRSIATGVTYTVAAGNNSYYASSYSPADVQEAITVGATDPSNDYRAYFSNYGSVLDIFAPGVNITSDWFSSDTATAVLSGTSMAAPHVAGVAALYLQNNPGAGTYAVASALVNNATTGVVIDPGPDSPNRLLYSNFISTPQFSLALNGTSAYVDVPNSASLNVTGAITVEAAIKTNVAGADQAIVERYNNYGGGTSDGGYVLRLVGGKLAFITLMNGGVYDYVIGSQDISPGYWHHVAGVFDGSQLRVYVDGGLVGSKPSTFALGTGTGNLRIGAKGDDLTIKFNGLIDEARVTADALYNANFNVVGMHELMPVANTRGYWKFNNQTANDSSGNGNNGVLVGGASFSTDVP